MENINQLKVNSCYFFSNLLISKSKIEICSQTINKSSNERRKNMLSITPGSQ